MGAVAILRALWHHRLVVLFALPLAIAVGLSVGYKLVLPFDVQSRRYDVGVASATALIDTPNSQVVAIGGRGMSEVATLPGRAALLANLLTTPPLREEIARRAGVTPSRLIVAAPAPSEGAAPESDALATGASVRADDRRASVLTLSTDVTLPIIAVDARAPDAPTAERVANAALTTLRAYVASVVSVEGVPRERRLVVAQLGPARSAITHQGPSPLLGVAAALAILGIVCAGVLLISALARDWRRMTAVDRLSEEAAISPEPRPSPGG
jgi:hypothetical protein